jgi:hypothetical protein
MDEEAVIDACLASIAAQTYAHVKLYACVNQPDNWWHLPEKHSVCEANARVLNKLNNFGAITIDRTSSGQGWQHKDAGVGMARKTTMDAINNMALPQDIIISLDADTVFDSDYFASVVALFAEHPTYMGLANPYYHKLTSDETLNRAILRYEIYMRCYIINLMRIGSPYAFTALGSALAVPVWAYRKIGGITPKKSGEDFYFLQKLRKTGPLLTWNKQCVYPSSRYSDRVFFGTGPALIKGSKGDWSSYPIYHHSLFGYIENTYKLFPRLFSEDVPTPLDDFLESQFGTKNIWQTLRNNTASESSFVAACHQKLDGLRLLQYLKWKQTHLNRCDEDALTHLLNMLNYKPIVRHPEALCLETSPIADINHIRDFLFEKENGMRRKNAMK